MTGIDMVLLQEPDDTLSHPVIACLTDKGGIQSCTSQGDKAVEHRTAWDGSDGLIVFKDDIENGLAYSYDFSHLLLLFMVAKIQKVYSLWFIVYSFLYFCNLK